MFPTPDVALVGGGSAVIDVFGPRDCRVELLDGGEDLALFNTGVGCDRGGSVVLKTIHDRSMAEHAEIMRQIDEIAFDALLPGHFASSLSDNMHHIAAANAALATLAVPKYEI